MNNNLKQKDNFFGYLFTLFFIFLTDKESKLWFFIYPFKHMDLFNKSRYKLIRLFSALSPFIIFPYTVSGLIIYFCLCLIYILYGIILFSLEELNYRFNNLKNFWDKV